MQPRRWIVPPVLALAGASAAAQPSDAEPLAWRCWYDQRVHITCVLRSAPAQLPAVSLPPNLPAFVRELRTDPQAFRDRFVHIPLISPVTDLRFAALLARATVCGSRAACSASFEPRPPSVAELRLMEARRRLADDAALLGAADSDLEPAEAAE